ncbi:hypothetical protein [Imhoffiella purpurea]|uniref:Uncharacterized protein n=1 Tax=Imhoffiella purpurea TaxID=1249627 RepID=W9VWZ5_9GAMM|nr:hypothetical protein [Imhoffiella purpurea]EXJ14940.1 hypothetical protein D779_1995 [Imhoffiella purpurea]
MQHLIAMLSADDLGRLDRRVLESKVGDLIRGYAHEGTAERAESVVRHLEALYLHPEVCRDPEEQCAYRRFARHWRWIAGHRGAPRCAAATASS